MASKFWLKLYHEILDDPKMGMMSDRLWRRTIEIFLLAGEHDQNGLLPPLDQVAWRLRISIEECNETFQKLKRCNILTCNANDEYIVTNFEKRQDASSNTERVQQFRQRKAKKPDTSGQNGGNQEQNNGNLGQNEPNAVTESFNPGNENETKRYTDIDIDIDIDTDSLPIGNGDKTSAPSTNSKKDKETVVIPEAVKVYQTVCKRYPAKETWPLIAEVGEASVDLQRWEKVIRAWIGCGWKPTNIVGMLDFFRKNELPSTSKNGVNQNGRANQTSIAGLRGEVNPIEKRADPKTGRTFFWDRRRKCEVPGPSG